MLKFTRTLIVAAALTSLATSAFSQAPWEFNAGTGYVFVGPGKMMSMAMNSKNHGAMMKNAKKVPNNTIFFMDGGQLYSVSGTLDATGNVVRP